MWTLGFSLVLVLCAFVRSSDVYFSPDGHIQDQLIKRIHGSHATMDVAMYSLTSQPIAQALIDAQRRGVRVRIVRDISQTADKGDADALLASHGIPIRLLKGRGRGIMHDKFALFDGQEGFTGSYNWTYNAVMPLSA